MSDTNQLLDDFKRYADLLNGAIVPVRSISTANESDTAIEIARGSVYANALKGSDIADDSPLVERLIELARAGEMHRIAMLDRSGHHRPVYRPLLIYAWLSAFRLRFEILPASEFGRWEEALRGWSDQLEAELGRITWLAGGMPALQGGPAAEAVWIALALHVAGKVFVRDAWIDLASDAFGRLTRGQQPAGGFLLASPDDNLELLWYHELTILHAAASYAVQAEDRAVAAAVERSTNFHFRETQPDHATTQPWALFAFLWNEPTRSLADQLLHGSSLQNPAGPDGLSLILLADALYCLRLFLV